MSGQGLWLWLLMQKGWLEAKWPEADYVFKELYDQRNASLSINSPLMINPKNSQYKSAPAGSELLNCKARGRRRLPCPPWWQTWKEGFGVRFYSMMGKPEAIDSSAQGSGSQGVDCEGTATSLLNIHSSLGNTNLFIAEVSKGY